MSLKDILAAATPGPWRAFKCPCGHKSCDQYTLSVQRSSGLEKPDADLAILAPDMAAALIEAEKALALHQAWSDSEDAGPDYGDQTRATHPDGERIWRQWWEGNLSLCDRAQEATKAALATIRKVTA